MAGWATVIFPDRLQLRVNEGYYGEPDPVLFIDEVSTKFYKYDVCKFFGLTELEACDAFGPEFCRTPYQEAVFLEELALSYGWEYA